MAVQRVPIYKRCAYLGVEPQVLGYEKKAGAKKDAAKAKVKAKPRSRPGEYALQLKEKQKVKFVYGVMERQFRKTFERALRMGGSTGENLMALMERRLDNTVFRLGFAKTRAEARQLVSHRHVRVNGARVNIPSLQVSPGDVLTLLRGEATGAGRKVPEWVSLDLDAKTATVLRNPSRSDVDFDVKESMIVEFYSK